VLQSLLNLGDDFLSVLQCPGTKLRLTAGTVRSRLIDKTEADIDIGLDQLYQDLVGRLASHGVGHNELQFTKSACIQAKGKVRAIRSHLPFLDSGPS